MDLHIIVAYFAVLSLSTSIPVSVPTLMLFALSLTMEIFYDWENNTKQRDKCLEMMPHLPLLTRFGLASNDDDGWPTGR